MVHQWQIVFSVLWSLPTSESKAIFIVLRYDLNASRNPNQLFIRIIEIEKHILVKSWSKKCIEIENETIIWALFFEFFIMMTNVTLKLAAIHSYYAYLIILRFYYTTAIYLFFWLLVRHQNISKSNEKKIERGWTNSCYSARARNSSIVKSKAKKKFV